MHTEIKVGQYYKIKATLDHIQNGQSGCPVYEDDDDDELVGFIDFISDDSMYIYLFSPGPLDFDCVVLNEQVAPEVWQARLMEIVKEGDDDVYDFWAAVFGTTEEDLE